MKFLVPNYSCLQNPWLGGYRPQIPVLSVLCPLSSTEFVEPHPEQNSWVRHWQVRNAWNDESVSHKKRVFFPPSPVYNDGINCFYIVGNFIVETPPRIFRSLSNCTNHCRQVAVATKFLYSGDWYLWSLSVERFLLPRLPLDIMRFLLDFARCVHPSFWETFTGLLSNLMFLWPYIMN